MARLYILDEAYDWIRDFFDGHSHSTTTKFGTETSSFANIMASVIQGSSLGPASFIVTAADLHPLQPGNVIIKFADDTWSYLHPTLIAV